MGVLLVLALLLVAFLVGVIYAHRCELSVAPDPYRQAIETALRMHQLAGYTQQSMIDETRTPPRPDLR